MVEIEILEQKNPLELKGRVKGVDSVFMNFLRRGALSYTNVLAIEEVVFRDNSSAMFDEDLAHRFGLLALKTPKKEFVRKDKCSCNGEGCAKCTVKLYIKVDGPAEVLAKDIKSLDPEVVPAQPESLIISLIAGQSLDADLLANVGIGTEHAKWATGIINFRNAANIRVKDSATLAKNEGICPKRVFSNGRVVNRDACDLSFACVQKLGEDVVSVTPIEDEFIFEVESFGQFSAKDLLVRAIEDTTARISQLKL